MENTAAFDEHRAWVASMYAQQAAFAARRDAPVGCAASRQSSASGSSFSMGTASPWTARSEESNGLDRRFANQLDSQFAALALSPDALVDLEYDERPVYRGLDMFQFSEIAPDVVDDGPVYRSGPFDSSSAADVSFDPLSASGSDAAEAEWLNSMPPLLKRQRGGILG